MNEIQNINIEKKNIYKENENLFPTWEQQLFINKFFLLNRLFNISGVNGIKYSDDINVRNEGDSYNFMPSIDFDTRATVMGENYNEIEVQEIINKLQVIDNNFFEYATENAIGETNASDYEDKVVTELDNFLMFDSLDKNFFYNQLNINASHFMRDELSKKGIYNEFLNCLLANKPYEYNIDYYGKDINILPTIEEDITFLLKIDNYKIKKEYLFDYFIHYFKDMLCNKNYEQEQIEIKINREEKLVLFEKKDTTLISFTMDNKAKSSVTTYPLIKEKNIKYPLEKENIIDVIKYFGVISGYYNVSEKEIENLSVDIIAEKLEADKNYLLNEMKEQLISTKKVRL